MAAAQAIDPHGLSCLIFIGHSLTTFLSEVRLWSCQKTAAELILHGHPVQAHNKFEEPCSPVDFIFS